MNLQVLFLIACLTQVCAFYHSNNLLVRRNLQKLNADLNLDSKVIVNWQKRLTTIVAAVIFSTSLNNPALADGDDKGSKKSFEMCYSICMFDATRPPPLGASTERLEVTKPRSEILRDCRVKCAKSKDQLLMGKPKVIKTPQTEAPKQE